MFVRSHKFLDLRCHQHALNQTNTLNTATATATATAITTCIFVQLLQTIQSPYDRPQQQKALLCLLKNFRARAKKMGITIRSAVLRCFTFVEMVISARTSTYIYYYFVH